MLNMPTTAAPQKLTFAVVFAASTKVAPIRFAIRVLPAIDSGNGICHVMLEIVARMDCAASSDVPR